MKLRGYLLALVSAVSYGLIPLFILPVKALHFPLDTTLFYRFLISALFILILGVILILAGVIFNMVFENRKRQNMPGDL